jgi:hypothetical protein
MRIQKNAHAHSAYTQASYYVDSSGNYEYDFIPETDIIAIQFFVWKSANADDHFFIDNFSIYEK